MESGKEGLRKNDEISTELERERRGKVDEKVTAFQKKGPQSSCYTGML